MRVEIGGGATLRLKGGARGGGGGGEKLVLFVHFQSEIVPKYNNLNTRSTWTEKVVLFKEIYCFKLFWLQVY